MARSPLRSAAALVTALMVGLVFSAAGARAPLGDLDLTFSGDGKQRTDFGFGSGATEGASGVALQPDGKTVAVGKIPGAFALARYNPNGSLDTSFSGDGKQTTSFGTGCCERANAVALQPNGKIVAVGRDEYGGWALARYNPGGSLDPSFSGDGKQTVNLCCGEAKGVALQANGKIVVVGDIEDDVEPGSRGFVVARLSPNGSLDPSFSGDGLQGTDFGSPRSEASGVAVRGDGKIVAVGFAGFAGNADFAIARFNPNGSFDTRFSGDGKQRTDFGGGYAEAAFGVALQPDGKVVAVGPGRSVRRFRLCPSPLQRERVARPELLRRRQAVDQVRVPRRGARGGAPGRRQDRRSRVPRRRQPAG